MKVGERGLMMALPANRLKMHTQSLFDRYFTHTREKEDVKILMYTPICDIIKQVRAAIECRKRA